MHRLLQLAYIFSTPRNGVIDREELSQLLLEGSSKLNPLTLVRQSGLDCVACALHGSNQVSNEHGDMLQKWISDAGISNIMDSFDGDGDGSISFDEFASLVRHLASGLQKWPKVTRDTFKFELLLNVQARAGSLLDGKFAEYRQAFKEVDTSGNGTIGSTEIQQLFHDLGQPLSETKLWKIFDKYDQVSCLEAHLPPAHRFEHIAVCI